MLHTGENSVEECRPAAGWPGRDAVTGELLLLLLLPLRHGCPLLLVHVCWLLPPAAFTL